ncbi:MAG: 2-oxo acid dehydrogenase subunit E2 [Propionibacteriaceae bacterium]|nr:2-oxo acid dehydrogenase subunit E2 [Propionibacteriaceae bacterium]
MSDVTLPPLGESVREATISRWMKAVGDTVTRDEPLLEVSTDKVDTEIPAPVSGVLWEIRFNEDDVAQVGDVLGVIGEADEPEAPATNSMGTFDRLLASLAAPPTAPTAQFDMTPYMASQSKVANPLPAWEAETDLDDAMEPTRVIFPVTVTPRPATPPVVIPVVPVPVLDQPHDTYVTPLVRKLAAELGVNLAQVHGTGVGGRIRKQDLLNIASRPLTESAALNDSPDPRRGTSQPPSPARVARAELATTSTLALAASTEVDVTAFRATPGGYIGAILQAVAASLKVNGELNASLLGDAVVFHNTENIGWVVDTNIGPLAPVIHDAGELAAKQLGSSVENLVSRAAEGSLSPADLAGGTFTVRNDGASGLAWAMPAINRPQVAAMSIGCVNHRADVLDDGTVTRRDTVFLTLAFDRRVADPGAAAAFLQRVKTTLSR